MNKIRCVFFDDNIKSLKFQVNSFNGSFEEVQKKYDFSLDQFEFEYFDSTVAFQATELVQSWKDKYDFIIVDARSSGDDQYTAVSETLVQVLEEYNIRHCIFTSDIKKLNILGIRKFTNSFVFKKEFKNISKKEMDDFDFNGNYYDMLKYIIDSETQFFQIVDYLDSKDDKKQMNDFLKKQIELEGNFSIISDSDLKSYSLLARPVLESIYTLLIKKKVIPNHGFFIGKSTNCNQYLTDLKNKNFIYNIKRYMQKEDLDKLSCDFSIFKYNENHDLFDANDLSAQKLENKKIGQTLQHTGIGNLLTFLYKFNSKEHHNSHIKMSKSDYRSILFSFNALLRRLIILLK